MADPAGAPIEIQIPTTQTASFCVTLAQALGRAGMGSGAISHVLERAVEALCPTCGIRLSGQEVADLAMKSEESANEPSKQRRVRLGYCAREGCDARFAVWKLSPASGADWALVLAKVKEIESVDEAETNTRLNLEAQALRRQRLRRRMIVFGVVAAVSALWYWYRSGAYLPGISRKPRTFIVEPGEGQAPSRATNQPRSFITR